MNRTALAACVAAALALAAIVAPIASAGVTCQTNAASEIAGANVNGPRAGWDPPVWTFDMPDLNMSVDVQDYTHDGAASKAQAWLQSQVDAACSQQATAPAGASMTSTAPTYDAQSTSQAQTLANAAPVTYVGNSWGPVPIYEVALPSLNMTIDVAAPDEASARNAVVPTIAAALGGTLISTTAPASNATPAASALPTSPTSVVAPSTNPTQALASAVVLNPDVSLGYLIRAGVGTDGALAPVGATSTG